MAVGAACADLPLVTGGSGIALGLPQNFRSQGLLGGDAEAHSAASLSPTAGLRAVVSGSCSVATQAQVEAMRAGHPAFMVDPLHLAEGEDVLTAALDWAKSQVTQKPVLIYATAAPELVKEIQARIGVARAGSLVDDALASIAVGLVELGVGQLIVAGGETSGAVVKALAISSLRIGPEIDPGAPWTTAIQNDPTRRGWPNRRARVGLPAPILKL